MAAVLNVDANLHAQLNADIQRELNMELNRLRAGQRVKDSEIAKVNLNMFKWRNACTYIVCCTYTAMLYIYALQLLQAWQIYLAYM